MARTHAIRTSASRAFITVWGKIIARGIPTNDDDDALLLWLNRAYLRVATRIGRRNLKADFRNPKALDHQQVFALVCAEVLAESTQAVEVS